MRITVCVVTLVLTSCLMTTKVPSIISFDDPLFELKPTIVYKTEDYYLSYRINNKETFNNRLQLSHQIAKDTIFYYFVGYSSFREYEKIIYVKIDKENLLNINHIYWMNPDRKIYKLNYP